jgi:hypothetical protein
VERERYTGMSCRLVKRPRDGYRLLRLVYCVALHVRDCIRAEQPRKSALDYSWIPPEQSALIAKAILLDLEAGGYQIVKKA